MTGFLLWSRSFLRFSELLGFSSSIASSISSRGLRLALRFSELIKDLLWPFSGVKTAFRSISSSADLSFRASWTACITILLTVGNSLTSWCVGIWLKLAPLALVMTTLSIGCNFLDPLLKSPKDSNDMQLADFSGFDGCLKLTNSPKSLFSCLSEFFLCYFRIRFRALTCWLSRPLRLIDSFSDNLCERLCSFLSFSSSSESLLFTRLILWPKFVS